MNKDVFGFIVGWFIYELLIKVVYYCDKFVFKRVNYILRKVENIICDDILRKYIE